MIGNDQIIQAWFDNLALTGVEAYVERGRRFEQLAIETLRLKWQTTVHDWSRAPKDATLVDEYQDLNAEFLIRREIPPVSDQLAYDILRAEALRIVSAPSEALRAEWAEGLADMIPALSACKTIN